MVGNKFAELGGLPGEGEGSDHDGGVHRATSVVANQAAAVPVCRCEKTGMVTAVIDAETGAYLGTDRTMLDKDRRVTEVMHPCPSCRPEQFQRYEAGCFRTDHDARHCQLCQNASPIKGAPKPRTAP